MLIPVTDLFGVSGRQLLETAGLDGPYRARIHAQLRLIDAFDFEIDTVSKQLRARLCQDHGYQVIQRIPGVGPVLAAVFVAEIGEADRFGDAAHLVSWAGLTPKHRESDRTVHRGPITKQGSGLVRWAAVEAAQKIPASAGWLVSSRARSSEPYRPTRWPFRRPRRNAGWSSSERHAYPAAVRRGQGP